VVNGFVRVDKERNDIARVMLEAHYFFTQTREFWFNSDVKKNEWGLGPFVAIQPGEKDMIQAIALGVMVGFKRNDKPDDTSSWNIGIGAVVDPSVKVLGDGLEVNAPLPSGEKEARLQEKSQWGVVVLTSFSF